MSDKEILTKAIKKAIDGGWLTMSDEWELRGNGVYWKGDATEIRQTYADIIFNHEFCKALWPNDAVSCSSCAYGGKIPCKYCKNDGSNTWQYHIQQMVISPDPIKYLGENI